MVDAFDAGFGEAAVINRKFTANQIGRIFCGFSAN
jgi:hypothetical protein